MYYTKKQIAYALGVSTVAIHYWERRSQRRRPLKEYLPGKESRSYKVFLGEDIEAFLSLYRNDLLDKWKAFALEEETRERQRKDQETRTKKTQLERQIAKAVRIGVETAISELVDGKNQVK